MKKTLAGYVEIMVESEHGVVSAGPERQVKLELARVSDADCFVVGSSRAMQASLREESWLTGECGTLANLGVSGGSFEDMMVYLSVVAGKKDKKVLVFMDPWGLSFEADARWRENSDLYYAHLKGVGLSEEASSLVDLDRVFNMVNYDYALAALEMLYFQGREALPAFGDSYAEPVPYFDHDSGHERAVRLSDGSLVYSADYIAGSSDREINSGGYKLRSVGVDERTRQAFFVTLKMLEDAGHDVEIVLAPYHPFVFSDDGDASVQDRILNVQSRLAETSVELGIPLRGGYDPRDSGCDGTEFFDSIHPSFSCIAKLSER